MTSPLATVLRKNVSSSKVGVVVSAGKMNKAVKVRIAERTWDKHIRKHFATPKNYLVADPNNSLVEGDVVRIASGHRTSHLIRHVVTAIVAPYGAPVEDRPPILTEEERLAERMKKRLEKDVRSAQNGRRTSITRIKEARRAGYTIPDLATAFRNVKVEESTETTKTKTNEEAHEGQAGQAVTKKQRTERRKELEAKAKEAIIAQEKAKKAKVQTVKAAS